MENKKALCELCGEPMPEGEEMFNYHGYSSNCPKSPLPQPKTLEKYLRENIDNQVIDFSIRATVESNGSVTFYIHPAVTSGETLDFIVNSNQLSPKSKI